MRLMYAIMRERDGRFLPAPPSGQKGGSWVEPACPTEQLPRMFRRERDAKGFLTVWLMGPQSRGSYQDMSGDFVEEGQRASPSH
jgi:hypothetical protein